MVQAKILFRALGRVAVQEGGKAARKLSAKIWEEANKRAMDKGLTDRPVTAKDALDRLKVLYADGKLNKEEFQRLKEEAQAFFKQSPPDDAPPSEEKGPGDKGQGDA